MALIVLVRHGESEANVKGILSHSYNIYPLTEHGKEEIRKLAEDFSGVIFDSFYSSPVLRARQSAEIISAAIKMEASIDERLRESSMGAYNNSPHFELPKGGREEKGLESWASIERRMRNFSEEVSGNVIAVSHQITIRAIIASYLNIGEPESYGIDIGRATISAIDTDRKKVLCVGARRLPERLSNILRESA
ncbi:MAG: histidine phosphatase family protein [Candidatus Thermoplasmatota archaeon]|nr:histidine phosphatase family protein [Candidatus Thermoplasmatota archaeon]